MSAYNYQAVKLDPEPITLRAYAVRTALLSVSNACFLFLLGLVEQCMGSHPVLRDRWVSAAVGSCVFGLLAGGVMALTDVMFPRWGISFDESGVTLVSPLRKTCHVEWKDVASISLVGGRLKLRTVNPFGVFRSARVDKDTFSQVVLFYGGKRRIKHRAWFLRRDAVAVGGQRSSSAACH